MVVWAAVKAPGRAVEAKAVARAVERAEEVRAVA